MLLRVLDLCVLLVLASRVHPLLVVLGVLALLALSIQRFSQSIMIPPTSDIFGKSPVFEVKPLMIEIPDVLGKLGEMLGDAAEATVEALGDAAEATVEALGDANEALGDAAEATGKALVDLGRDIGNLFGSNSQPNTKNYPRDDTSQNRSMVKMISMYPPLDEMPNGRTTKRANVCNESDDYAIKGARDTCYYYNGTVRLDTPNGVSVCNTGWKCEGYNFMGKRIDGNCNDNSAHKTQFQMTCDDDGSFDVPSGTPYWHIYSPDNNVWMFLDSVPYGVNRKTGRGYSGDNNDTRVVIREESGRVVDFGQLEPYTPYFIQSFANPSAWLGCDEYGSLINKVTLKSVSKLEAKKWEFTGGMNNKIKLSDHSGYYIRAGKEYGEPWIVKSSAKSTKREFNLWHPKNNDFEAVPEYVANLTGLHDFVAGTNNTKKESTPELQAVDREEARRASWAAHAADKEEEQAKAAERGEAEAKASMPVRTSSTFSWGSANSQPTLPSLPRLPF